MDACAAAQRVPRDWACACSRYRKADLMHRNTRKTQCIRALVVWFAMTARACAPATTPGEGAALAAHAETGTPASEADVQEPAETSGEANAASGAPADDPNAASDTADSRTLLAVDSEAAATQSPSWWVSAPGQMVSGQVFAADSGEPLKGVVCTTAQCTGTGCASTEYYGIPCSAKPVVDGTFSFDADATLTLTPTSQFWFVGFNGYAPLAFAHGPVIPAEKDWTSPRADTLPTLYLCTQQATDTDHDGICNDAEVRYGTDPVRQDSDSDALSDTLELYGYPFTGADNNLYDLRGVGADPNHADIFLGVRYTERSQLSQRAFAPVIQAFEDAPWTQNRDGSTGIRLHVLYDSRAITGLDDVGNIASVWGTFDMLQAMYYGARPYAFHYALVMWQFAGTESSGISRDWGAADFVVATGALEGNTAFEQAGTLMHELGHNLGLRHNGYSDENDLPHYMSVMNYAYQVYGIETTGGTKLDYARIEIAPVDEQHLNETAPFPPAGSTTTDDLATYLNPRVKSLAMAEGVYNTPVMGSLQGPLDLDGYNGIETDVAIDLNGNGLWDFYPQTRNDWGTLRLGGGPMGMVGDAPASNTTQRAVDSSVAFPPCRAPRASDAATPASASPDSTASPSIPLTDPSTSAALPTTSSSTPVSAPSSNAPSPQVSVPSIPASDESDLDAKAMTPGSPDDDPTSDDAKKESAPEHDPAATPDPSGPVDSNPADATDRDLAAAEHSMDPAATAPSDPPQEEPSKPADAGASAAEPNPKDSESDGSNPNADPAPQWPWPF
jgi:hypothetical protein